MRYALRNQDKIVKVHSQEKLNIIIKSLDKHFSENKEIIHSLPSEGKEPYDLLLVDNVNKEKAIIAFYIIEIKYDVYRLAFKEFIG